MIPENWSLSTIGTHSCCCCVRDSTPAATDPQQPAVDPSGSWISRPNHDEETQSTLSESCFKQGDNGPCCRGPPPLLACLQAVYAYTTSLEDPRLDDVWTPKIELTGIRKNDTYPWLLAIRFSQFGVSAVGNSEYYVSFIAEPAVFISM